MWWFLKWSPVGTVWSVLRAMPESLHPSSHVNCFVLHATKVLYVSFLLACLTDRGGPLSPTFHQTVIICFDLPCFQSRSMVAPIWDCAMPGGLSNTHMQHVEAIRGGQLQQCKIKATVRTYEAISLGLPWAQWRTFWTGCISNSGRCLCVWEHPAITQSWVSCFEFYVKPFWKSHHCTVFNMFKNVQRYRSSSLGIDGGFEIYVKRYKFVCVSLHRHYFEQHWQPARSVWLAN